MNMHASFQHSTILGALADATQLGSNGRLWLIDELVDDNLAQELVDLIRADRVTVKRIAHGGAAFLEVLAV